MKAIFGGLAAATLLVIASGLPGSAEDAPGTAPQPPAVAPAEAPPVSVPRPSLRPGNTEPAPPPVAADPAPTRHQRYTQRRIRRAGHYRTAYWEPFPIYWPHLYRNRVHWNRIPWPFSF